MRRRASCAPSRKQFEQLRAARASAYLSARDFVIPDDVKEVAVAALRHRIILSPEMEIESYRSDDVIREILEKVEAPRE